MHPNFLFVPTFLSALLLFFFGAKVASVGRSSTRLFVWFALAAVLAIPALLFVVCYAHVLDQSAWFYAFRAAPGSELSASGLGLGAGLLLGMLRRAKWAGHRVGRLLPLGLAFLCASVLFVPYLKPFIAPIRIPLHDQWSGGVCLQSSPSTCGPASAATLLRQFHVQVSERDLARECFSYRGGTENWYVARALRNHGLKARYVIASPDPDDLPFLSMAGVQMGGARSGGHFITVLGKQGNRIIIGDPLVGRLALTREQLRARYYFTGFFLIATRS